MSRIYSATYSNVPVYEFNVAGNHVMRRRSDDWINATHILKVADFDKPARTRILEREVQKGTHEKVQGGYGKYQGTWVPLPEGRMLAERNGVLEKLAPIFDYVPGDRSPPPAPKHATAASNKPKAPRQPARRVPRNKPTTNNAYTHPPTNQYAEVPQHQHRVSGTFDNFSVQLNGDETPDNGTMVSASDDEMVANSQYSGSHKRKRGMEKPHPMSFEDIQHLQWSDELLDYFMLQHSHEPPSSAPVPPSCVDINRPVDDKGHTPMHWAAAMGDLNIVQDLIRRGARIDTLASNGETPLMRAVMFTNNWAQQTMERLIGILHSTVGGKDWFGSTVFHQIAMMTCSKSKYSCARYYIEAILATLDEFYAGDQIKLLLDQQDHNGDTAIMIAARNGARKCVRTLMEHGANAEIPNINGDIADTLIKNLNTRRRDRQRQGSSSPALPTLSGTHLEDLAEPSSHLMAPHLAKAKAPAYRSEAAAMLASQLPFLINTRAEALAASLEASLAEREVELREAERLIVQRRAELEALRKQSDLLDAQLEETSGGMSPDAFDEQQRRELEALSREAEALLEAEQALEVRRIVRDEEAKMPPEELLQGPATSQQELSEKLHLARALDAVQSARPALIKSVVAAQALAGVGQKHHIYRRLISAALKIKEEDVEALLPDILNELEDTQADMDCGVVGQDDGMDGTAADLHRMMMGATQLGMAQGRMGYMGQAPVAGGMYAPLGPPNGNEMRVLG